MNTNDTMLNIRVVLDDGAFVPKKSHTEDAGFDLQTPRWCVVKAHSSLSIDTGVHIGIPYGYCGFLKSKSGLNIKYGITCEGVIDCGYTGSIVAKLRNDSDKDFVFEAGDKITQIVILPIPEVEMTVVSSLEETERGNNGFGSTGR